MAKKAESFRLDTKKKVIVIYTNVDCSPAEQSVKEFYLAQGFAPKFEEKKKTLTVKDMRAELKADPNALKAFDTAYKKEAPSGKDVKFSETGFAEACRIYNDWKKKNK